MPARSNDLGVMKPMGGGDPVPLRKAELVIGRRPSCDIRLDFDNISGKHCMLRYHNQVWHVRDLGSTNGTTVNGAPLSTEHSVMPDDELGIAGHFYQIDYDPGAPEAILRHKNILDEDVVEAPKRHSLVELAGLDTDHDRYDRNRRPNKSPGGNIRSGAEEADVMDPLPEEIKMAPTPAPLMDDDDFLKLIQDDVTKPKK